MGVILKFPKDLGGVGFVGLRGVGARKKNGANLKNKCQTQ